MNPPTPKRSIFIGDVHGCAHELSDLLEKLAPVAGDTVVFVGDLVRRGPFSNEVLQIARKLDAVAVMGNHEQRLLQWRKQGKKPEEVSRIDEAGWAYLNQMPLWYDRPQQRLRVVHAGVVPDMSVRAQQPLHLLTMREITSAGEPTAIRDAGTLWGELYQGPPHILFGHNARPEPQLHPWATGLDTGCVYGGRLTALCLPADAPVPPIEERQELLVSVPARRDYVPI